MAMRSAAVISCSSLSRLMEGAARRTSSSASAVPRYFSTDGKGGRVLSEEERAAENIYIQKMERERMEKMKRREETEKAEKAKESADKKPEGESHKG
ncbi:hypothetical protein Ancab_001157 [Ancistrocladus abbreviatus]